MYLTFSMEHSKTSNLRFKRLRCQIGTGGFLKVRSRMTWPLDPHESSPTSNIWCFLRKNPHINQPINLQQLIFRKQKLESQHLQPLSFAGGTLAPIQKVNIKHQRCEHDSWYCWYVGICSLSQYSQVFNTFQVVQDFLHQQSQPFSPLFVFQNLTCETPTSMKSQRFRMDA